MPRWSRVLAALLAVVLLIGIVDLAYHLRQRRLAATHPSPSVPAATLPAASPAGPTQLIVVDRPILAPWVKRDAGEVVTVRALQGLLNRSAPTLFVLQDLPGGHDEDWLRLLSQSYAATLVTKPDSTRRIDDLAWYLTAYRSRLAGYIVFDGSKRASDGPSANVALSLAGALDAVPIARTDTQLLQAASAAGLKQLADVSGDDYAWLKSSSYWGQLSRDAVYLNQPSGIMTGADYAVAQGMAVFWDDVRGDRDMRTMSDMISGQRAGGFVFGWGYTDDQYREDVFVSVASRFSQSVMDLPANISVYMHYPLGAKLANRPAPPAPTDLATHYVAFVYSDGDNPRVVFDDLTKPGNDRYASPQRGKIPIGWTLPPALPDLAAPVVAAVYGAATADDVFLAGPSGYGYTFPSEIPAKQLYAAKTQEAMARMDLHSALVLDYDGGSGFTPAAVGPLMSQPNVGALFFTAFNGRQQPAPASVLWSNGKPVIPTVTLYRPPGQGSLPIASKTDEYLNSQPRNARTAGGYTLVYVDFWSVSMSDIAQIVGGLDSHVVVVRPDVLAAMMTANVAH